MAPRFRSDTGNITGTTSASFTLPTGTVQGDLEFIIMESTDSATTGGTPNTPSGWDKIFENTISEGVSGQVSTLTVFSRVAPASPAAVTVDGVLDHLSGVRLSVVGGSHAVTAPSTDIDVGTAADHGTGTTNLVTPELSGITADSLILWIMGLSDDAADTSNASGQTNGNFTSITEQHDTTVATGAGGGVSYSTALCAGTTTGSAGNWDHDTGVASQSVYIAIPPAPPGIFFVSQTQIASGGATDPMSAPALPSATATGDMVLLFAIVKYASTTINTPASWTPLNNGEGANSGLTDSGNDAGNVRAAIFWREKDAGWSTMPAIDLSGLPNSTMVGAITYARDGVGTGGLEWGTPEGAVAVDDATGSTGIDPAASGTTLALTTGDVLGSFAAVNGDAGTLGAHTVTVSGVTFGTQSTRLNAVSSSGTDLRGHSVDKPYSSGTAAAGPDGALALTSGAASGAGVMVFYRLRLSPPPVSATMAASLGSLTASLTAEAKRPATMAAPLGSLVGVAASTVTHPVTMAAPLGSLTATTSVSVTHAATMAAPLGALTATMSAHLYWPATMAAPLGGLTAAALVTKKLVVTMAAGPPGAGWAFVADVESWFVPSLGLSSLAYSTAFAHSGPGSLRCRRFLLDNAAVLESPKFAVKPGRDYAASLWSYADTKTADIRVLIRWYNAALAFISVSASTDVTDAVGSWTAVVGQPKTAPPTAAFASVQVNMLPPGPAGEFHYWDDVVVVSDGLGRLNASMSAGVTVLATMSAPLGALTASLTASVIHPVTMAAPLGSLVATATAGVTVQATMAAPLGGLTATVTAGVKRLATMSAPLGGLTATMAATPTTPAATINATMAAPLGALTAAAAATVTPRIEATMAAPLGGLTGIVSASVMVPVTLAAPLGALTAAVTAKVRVPATMAASLGALSAVTTAVATVPVTMAAPLGALTAAATATPIHPVTMAAPLGSLVATATAVVRVPSTAVAPLGALTASITTSVIHPATMAAPLGSLVAATSAAPKRPATLAAPLGSLTAAMTATATTPTSPELDAPLGALTASITATVRVSATLSAPLGGLVATASATVKVPVTMAAPLGGLTAAASAGVQHASTMAAPLGSLSAVMAAVPKHPVVLTAPLGGLTATMAATATTPASVVPATMAAPLGGLSATSAAGVKHPVTMAAPLGALTAATTAGVKHLVTGASPLGALIATMGVTVKHAVTLAAPLGGLTGGATAAPEHSASLAAPLGPLAGTIVATARHLAVLSADLGPLLAVAAAASNPSRLFAGSDAISAVYRGSTPVIALHLGSVKVWP